MQAVHDAHDTPWRTLNKPVGLGVLWIVQLVPFQRSARGTFEPLVATNPTAVHAVPAVHDTPFTPLSGTPAGLGVLWSVQLVPFQASASVAYPPALVR